MCCSSVRHAVASHFLRVWSFLLQQQAGPRSLHHETLFCLRSLRSHHHFLHFFCCFCRFVHIPFQGVDDDFIISATNCIVALASDTTLGSASFIADSCGAVGIIESLCATIAAKRDADSEIVCSAALRCMQTLVHHHLKNQGRLCASGGLAAVTQCIVGCTTRSVPFAVAIVAHVASSSRAGFDAAVSCGGVNAVFMSGVLCNAETQTAIASTIFDMVCSGPRIAALVRHQCDVEDGAHIQPFSLLLQSEHPDIRKAAHKIVTRLGSNVEDRSHAEPLAHGKRTQLAQRWK
jgi:hypothetical protein